MAPVRSAGPVARIHGSAGSRAAPLWLGLKCAVVISQAFHPTRASTTTATASATSSNRFQFMLAVFRFVVALQQVRRIRARSGTQMSRPTNAQPIGL